MIVHAALEAADLERVHRIVELDPFPACAIVVLVEDEIGLFPFASFEDQAPRLLMRRINQLGKLPETGIDEETVGLGQPAHVLKNVLLIHVIEASAQKTDRAVEIELVARRIVVIEIESDGNPVGSSFDLILFETGGLGFGIGRRIVQHTDSHFGQTVAVGIVKQERILPIDPQILHPVGGSMDFDEGRIAVIVSVEIGNAVFFPTFEFHHVPVDVIELSVAVGIEHDHIMAVGPSALSLFGIVRQSTADRLFRRHSSRHT